MSKRVLYTDVKCGQFFRQTKERNEEQSLQGVKAVPNTYLKTACGGAVSVSGEDLGYFWDRSDWDEGYKVRLVKAKVKRLKLK
mgnify:CR=1 FL=1